MSLAALPVSAQPAADSTDAHGDRLVFERPEHVRGLYLNAWTAGSSRRLEQLLDVARRTEINSFVIDIKDVSGYVSHATRIPLAREVGATGERRIGDLRALLERLHDEGVYPIARIVIVKDPLLAAGRPEWAIQDTAGGVWLDRNGDPWMNMFHRGVWDYHIELALEVAEAGFPEIQWDYVRFPDAPRSDIERSTYPGRDGKLKKDAIPAFLRHAREALDELGVQQTADVFGVTTSAGDVGIGQVWELFIETVDVALPMVYPSHYWRGSFGHERPNARPYEIVHRALELAVRRNGRLDDPGAIRPWLQDFDLGEPPYGPAEVRAQIQAAYDVGIHEWILWNPGSRYTEEALEPVGGFPEEPLIRIGDRYEPVSRRHEVLDSVARAKEVADSLRAAADTAGVRPGR